MLNILLVEDNLAQRNALKKLISSSFHNTNISIASDYDSALQLCQDEFFNLFILDIQLDSDKCEENGLLLAEKIRAKEQHLHTPIIFITALPDKIYQAVNNLHCFGYITKPYNNCDVINIISSITRQPDCQHLLFNVKDINGIYTKLSILDLLYIKIEHHNYYLFTKKGTVSTTNTSFKSSNNTLIKQLVRCHKSYYVNPLYIQIYDKATGIIFLHDAKIPVGRNYKSNVEGAILKNA